METVKITICYFAYHTMEFPPTPRVVEGGIVIKLYSTTHQRYIFLVCDVKGNVF